MKVYLAGKVGGRKWEVVKPLANVEWVASDGSNHSEHLWGTGGFIPWDKIGQESLAWGVDDAIKKIIVADCLVAYLDTHDCYGSIVELTLAAAYYKPCLLVVRMPPMIIDDDDPPGFPCFDAVAERMADAYWFVSCLPGVRSALIESEAEATDVIRGFLLQTHRHIPKTRGEV
jgi:hypothetical protein